MHVRYLRTAHVLFAAIGAALVFVQGAAGQPPAAPVQVAAAPPSLHAPGLLFAPPPGRAPRPCSTTPGISASHGRLPLQFEANTGQTDARVKFLSRGRGYTLFLTANEAVLSLSPELPAEAPHPWGPAGLREPATTAKPPGTVLRMKLVGANRAPHVAGAAMLPGKVNYLRGKDPRKWRTNVPTYGKVRYQGVYRGVDLVYYGNQGQLEYDFVVAPGADPKVIALAFEGAERVSTDAGGALVLRAGAREVRFGKPRVYQEIAGRRVEVASRWAVAPERPARGTRHAARAHFRLAAYDRRRPLVIDPELVYLETLGRAGGFGIAVDAAGCAYVTGGLSTADFPSTSGTRPWAGEGDAFVMKRNAKGGLIYATYLGGRFDDIGYGIAVDAAGCAYVAGYTVSTDFPTLPGARAYAGGPCDAFVTKLNTDGTDLVYSTYLGGGGEVNRNGIGHDAARGIALDAEGCAYVTGQTNTADFPTTLGPLSFGGFRDAFVSKLDAAGVLIYSTCLGGDGDESGDGIAVDGAGCAYVAGTTTSPEFPTTLETRSLGGFRDAFVTKLDAEGTGLVYSTYLGGSSMDWGSAIVVDGAGRAYVTGVTDSTDFPTTVGARPSAAVPVPGSFGVPDAFVTNLDTAGGLVYSTCLGGGAYDQGLGIAVDGDGCAYVTGDTWSSDFPATPGARPYVGDGSDAFVAKLDPRGTGLVYATCLRAWGWFCGSGRAIAADGAGCAYVTGMTYFMAKLGAVPYDETPPTVTASASPAVLWPPNHKMVPVLVAGKMADGQSGVDHGSAAFSVHDDYGLVQPGGPVTLQPDGSYSFTVQLEAWRNAQDKGGRRYTVTVRGADRVGNQAEVPVVVTVPRDPGK